MTATPAPAQLVAVLTPDGPRVLAADDAIAHADDLGLTRGDGCFDATLVRPREAAGGGWWDHTVGAHAVLNLGRHVARLGRSAASLSIDAPQPEAITGLVDAAVSAWPGTGEAMLKLVLTRGREEHPGGPLAYATITALGEGVIGGRDGIDVVTLSRGTPADAYADAPWLLGGVKTISYGIVMAAQREARSRGADDALWTSTDGWALEGPTSSLVLLRGDTLVSVPAGPTGILASITVETLFEAAPSAGLRTEYAMVRPDEIVAADAAWLVSSVRGIAPIRRLDGREVPADRDADARVAALAQI